MVDVGQPGWTRHGDAQRKVYIGRGLAKLAHARARDGGHGRGNGEFKAAFLNECMA